MLCYTETDNAKEFTRSSDVENATGLAVYFADPYSARQRGTNENTNGLLRSEFTAKFGLDPNLPLRLLFLRAGNNKAGRFSISDWLHINPIELITTD